MTNGLVQHVTVEESTSIQLVKILVNIFNLMSKMLLGLFGEHFLYKKDRRFHLIQFIILLCVSVPTENVATIPHNAIVTEGVSRSRNALINGDIRQYDWDSGYTCHQLGSGCIVIQFPQPYIIGCMR